MKRSFRYYLSVCLKGMAMGAADVIPGVSGGTIAFITGIYRELIDSISSVNIKNIKILLSGRFRDFLDAVNGKFLLTLVLGIGFSILSLARGMQYLLDHHPVLVWSFFFGLIVASAVYVARNIDSWGKSTFFFLLAGVFSAWLITVMTPARANTGYGFIFLSGSLAICAMILPGISGSFILVLLGMYRFILGALTGFNLSVIIIFLAGALIGIVLFSNLLSWLLRKFYSLTIAMLAGFMIGSLNKVWPWKQVLKTFVDRHGEIKPLLEQNVLPGTYARLTGQDSQLGFALLLAVTGFMLIFVIERLSRNIINKP